MENKEKEKVYTININKKASKFLSTLQESYYSAVVKAIWSLSENPRPFGYTKLTGEEAYRIRVGDYRIIYEIYDDVLIIEVVKIDHRKDVYKKK